MACNPNFQEFFDAYIPLIRPMARNLATNEDFLLALVAFEDTWGRDEHNKLLHNIFGLTKAGGRNLHFPTYQACIDYFTTKYKQHFYGVSTLQDWIAGMKKVPYNTVNPVYYIKFTNTYLSVVKHKGECAVK
ncbi:hypothetical protein SAMN02745857_03120 [Andreprevotia lacus DSM 23236]|uniref:Uncharacterized protein n=1 Tax=Andreprevotia lacus DSM 23236 TaxID=1121001 RepID=A0A1W1XW72_9NEIS|nr:hypothetical protein [Andreprevotia lacus]SMC28105.1 hypothetical protein SAMN02745857_03120 [Andreprevotia lacus DSM 23236]